MKTRLSFPGASEHQIQCAFVEWAIWNLGQRPELELLFAVPNGGNRQKGVAGKLKAEGVRAGVPDMWLPVPRRGFAGLVMEFKEPAKGKVSATQARWLELLTWHGYCTAVVWSTESAIDLVCAYLDGGYEQAETTCPFHVGRPAPARKTSRIAA